MTDKMYIKGKNLNTVYFIYRRDNPTTMFPDKYIYETITLFSGEDRIRSETQTANLFEVILFRLSVHTPNEAQKAQIYMSGIVGKRNDLIVADGQLLSK